MENVLNIEDVEFNETLRELMWDYILENAGEDRADLEALKEVGDVADIEGVIMQNLEDDIKTKNYLTLVLACQKTLKDVIDPDSTEFRSLMKILDDCQLYDASAKQYRDTEWMQNLADTSFDDIDKAVETLYLLVKIKKNVQKINNSITSMSQDLEKDEYVDPDALVDGTAEFLDLTSNLLAAFGVREAQIYAIQLGIAKNVLEKCENIILSDIQIDWLNSIQASYTDDYHIFIGIQSIKDGNFAEADISLAELDDIYNSLSDKSDRYSFNIALKDYIAWRYQYEVIVDTYGSFENYQNMLAYMEVLKENEPSFGEKLLDFFTDYGVKRIDFWESVGEWIYDWFHYHGRNPIIGSVVNDTLDGTDGSDLIICDAGDDTANGGDGDDRIYGGSGKDTLNGDAGNDWIYGGEDDDTIDGGTGDDYLYGNEGGDTIHGGSGNDDIFGDTPGEDWGSDFLYGDDGDDLIEGGAGDDYIEGGSGRDEIYGGSDNDTIYGDDQADGEDGRETDTGEDNDTIFGGDGDDTIFGQTGDDYLEGRNGNNHLYGGNGNDTLVGGEDTDHMYGGNGNDYFIGGNGPNYMYGEEGDDTMQGGDGYDYMEGGNGNDTMSGGNGFNEMYGQDGDDSVYGGNDVDHIYGGEGNDSLYGGNGENQIDGEAGDDIIYDGDDSSRISGGIGNDSIFAGGGNDEIDPGEGNDYIQDDHGDDTVIFKAGYGIDTISDASGNNTIQISGLSLHDMRASRTSWSDLTLSFGSDALILKQFFDGAAFQNFDLVFDDGTQMHADQINELYGSDGDDWLALHHNGGILHGGAGNDTINGGNGNDALYGDADNDTLYGEIGDDILDGGTGNDYLYGGNGNDTYIFGKGYGMDTIEDWGGSSVVKFGDIIADEITISNANDANLILTVQSTGDQLYINGYKWNQDGYTFVFADGTSGTVNRETWELELEQPASAPETAEDVIQSNADTLSELYADDSLTSDLLTEPDSTVISDISDSVSVNEESDEVADQTDIQVMILTENMSAFADEDNVFDNSDILDPTSDMAAVDQLLVGSNVQ